MEIDLSTEYLGMKLKSPLVASSSPTTGQPDVLSQLEECGAGAAVLPSLFEEQVIRASGGTLHSKPLPEFPYLKEYNRGAEHYARLVRDARAAVAMPIIGSLNGATPGGWVEHAQHIADAGADALELNLHSVPIDPSCSGQMIEAQYLDVIAAVRQRVLLPLAVKVGPYFTSLPFFARQAVDAGADALVLFNRLLEPDVNLDDRAVQTHLELSRPGDGRLSLRWIGVLRDQLPQVCSLAASTGIHSGMDALKALSIGADVTMVTSALLKHGVEHLKTIREEMIEWLTLHEYVSVRKLVGTMSRESCDVSEAFERANYALTVSSYLEYGAISS